MLCRRRSGARFSLCPLKTVLFPPAHTPQVLAQERLRAAKTEPWAGLPLLPTPSEKGTTNQEGIAQLMTVFEAGRKYYGMHFLMEGETGKMTLHQQGIPLLDESYPSRDGLTATQTAWKLVARHGWREGKAQLE